MNNESQKVVRTAEQNSRRQELAHGKFLGAIIILFCIIPEKERQTKVRVLLAFQSIFPNVLV